MPTTRLKTPKRWSDKEIDEEVERLVAEVVMGVYSGDPPKTKPKPKPKPKPKSKGKITKRKDGDYHSVTYKDGKIREYKRSKPKGKNK